MTWDLVMAAISTCGAIVLALLYGRATAKAAYAEQLKSALDHVKTTLAASQGLVAGKEEYIRELEKTVLGSLPAGKLAERLTGLFKANRGGAPGAVPAAKPAAKPAKP
jgi:hypothetical protein